MAGSGKATPPAIGGYRELELRTGEHFHPQAIRLNTARNCFEYLLRTKGYKRVYLPHYTCEVMLEPLRKLGIEWQYYHIDRYFDPVERVSLRENEAYLYTNYYGLKQERVKALASIYGNRLIVDNAQAFFSEPVEGISTFYSARKFFGVPDGAYLYTDTMLDEPLETDRSFDRMQHLLKRIDLSAEEGYADFQTAEASLCNQPIRRMSALTDKLLRSIDYDRAAEHRQKNYRVLQKELDPACEFPLGDHDVPMAFPFRTDNPALRQRLIARRIYIPCYWPNVLTSCSPAGTEYELAERCLPLPLEDVSYLEIIKKETAI